MDSRTLEMRKQAPTSEAEMLRRWRKVIGLSQKDLARLAGVSQAHVSDVERGRTEEIGGKLKTFLEAVARRRARYFPVH